MIRIRPAAESDLDEMWRIQSAALPAVDWNVADYLRHECLIATIEDRVAGFAVARHTAPDELEILNVAVDPPLRRRGAARSLIAQLLANFRGNVYLEVRQSNLAARELYHSLGFEASGVRKDYYDFPGESAIVMKFHSC
ncbi:MAG: ribosomal protein S18-alanine N-acetyltransferase [Acidobacteriia bacterium]|nr:ribosomal protein S18-alanine N-acetyltransferase [Terriglobia bacterium]